MDYEITCQRKFLQWLGLRYHLPNKISSMVGIIKSPAKQIYEIITHQETFIQWFELWNHLPINIPTVQCSGKQNHLPNNLAGGWNYEITCQAASFVHRLVLRKYLLSKIRNHLQSSISLLVLATITPIKQHSPVLWITKRRDHPKSIIPAVVGMMTSPAKQHFSSGWNYEIYPGNHHKQT